MTKKSILLAAFLIIFSTVYANNEQMPKAARELAEIAVITGRTTRALAQMEPRIAMLSFSTRGSAKHEMVDRIVRRFVNAESSAMA